MGNTSDVVEGRDGWLFLTGGSNSPLAYYLDPNATQYLATEWAALIDDRLSRLAEQGITYRHIAAPNKLSVYPEFFPEELAGFSAHPIRAVVRELKKKNHLAQQAFVNPVPFFNRQKSTTQLYWKTDSHWTYQGCFCAYQLVCASLGVRPNNQLLSRPYTEGRIALDLGGKFQPPIKEKARFYNAQMDSERIFANELVIFKEEQKRVNDIGLHVGSYVVYHNPSATEKKKLLLFGDSFSEYRPNLLTAMFAETFREVHFIWSANIDFDYVERIKPDILITELVERFMPQVPNDRFVLDKHVAKLLH